MTMYEDHQDESSICFNIEQLEETRSISNCPERNLCIAVIARAVQDWIGKDLNLAEQAREWFMESKVEEPAEPEEMSLQHICDILDLDYDKFKSATERYVAKVKLSQSFSLTEQD